MKEEYVDFIKTFLVVQCINEYCHIIYSTIYEKEKYPIEEYHTKLLSHNSDKTVWNEVFIRLHDVLKYYDVIKNYETIVHSIGTINPMNTYPQNKLDTLYEQGTFQEYIDELFNFNNLDCTMAEYRRYVSNITKNESEYKKIIQKYNNQVSMTTLKNHIIYLVKMYISKNTKTKYIFSEEEKEEMDVCLNIIPYFEYIGSLNMTLEDVSSNDDNYIEKNEEDMEEYMFYFLQHRVLRKIKEKLL